ncbi:MAG: PTS sugar transporter subunit IIA [Desulfomonile sp.]|nr:PTS sugar transporter subunit IIA [Desulfomonile sp.]
MIGILISTHGELGDQFIRTARMIGLTSEEHLTTISIDPADSPEKLVDRVQRAIKKTEAGDGVLILTDLFGGTPTNIALSFLEPGKVEVVTGLNLPMLIKAINAREGNDLATLAKIAAEAGKENIYLAGSVFGGRLARKGRVNTVS